jgi:saccharopine dehydrogenase (NAD+, L-lysine-forming)
MRSNTFLILGGYGNAGIVIARLLLNYTSSNVIIAARSYEKANAAAVKLNLETNSTRVSALRVDAADALSLEYTFRLCNFLIAASSTSEYTLNICNAAIKAGVDYLDIQFSKSKLQVLKSFEEKIKASNRCFITDGGFHPGLPAVMIRYAARFFDEIETANVASMIRVNWKEYNFSQSTMIEFIAELQEYNPSYFADGKWIKAKLSYSRKFNFNGGFKNRRTVPFMLEEMKLIPETYPSIKETDFFVGGFNWFVDYFILPLVMVFSRLYPKSKKSLSKFLIWGLKKFSRPPYRTILKLEAGGFAGKQRKSIEMFVSHEDSYFLTAVPVIACILQYLDESNKRTGLYTMAYYVEPARFINDLKMMGVNVSVRK